MSLIVTCPAAPEAAPVAEAPRQAAPIASLNGLRAVSVILVIASHLATSVSTPPSLRGVFALFNGYLFNGALGVRLFFCLSGFLITTLLLQEQRRTGRIDLRTFYIRRALRIWPVLYAFVLFMFVAHALTALAVSPCQFASALTFTKNYGCSSWIDGHLWSLGVEFQFYLFWPAILVALSRRAAVAMAVAAVLASPLSRLIEADLGTSQWWLTSNMDTLMVGALAALAHQAGPQRMARLLGWRPALLRALAVALMVAPVVTGRLFPDAALQILFGPTAQAWGAASLILSCAFGPAGWSTWALNARPVNFIGLISFSLYVWQEPFFIWPADFGYDRLLTFEWPFNVVGMCLVATLSYYCLERPLLTLRRRFSAR